MRKSNVLIVVLLLFSIVVEVTLAVMTVQAETKQMKLIDDNFLKLSYTYEKINDSNQWQLNYDRQCDEEDYQQRLKVKITDEKEHVIDYPEIANMVEKDGWLIEKEFTAKKEGHVKVGVCQSIKKLNLYVQMDQRKVTEEDDAEIDENILKRDEPFILEASKTVDKQKTKDSSSKTDSKPEVKASSSKPDSKKKAEKVTAASEEFIGPLKEKNQVALSGETADAPGMSSYRNVYENKDPEYDDTGGKHPIHSWQPNEQTNVINHQGGIAGESGWDRVPSWNVAEDDHTKSYIKYGEDSSDPNISIRKYAQQTDNPDEFKIKLNVKGNTSYKPGVDVVFLLDNSGSMLNSAGGSKNTKRKNTVAALETIINKLIQMDPNNKEQIRVGAKIFSDYRFENEVIPASKLSSKHSDWTDMVKKYRDNADSGHTFTQRGLREAADIFKSAPDIGTRYKLLFVLTDGAPNRSWKAANPAIPDSSMYFDPYYINFANIGSPGNYAGYYDYKNGDYTRMPAQGVLTSHLTTTNSTAKDIKEKEGVEIHTIGVNIDKIGSSDHSKEELIRGLYKMSTKKANAGGDTESDYFYYDVDNSDELTEVFKGWYETVIRTVDHGVITDPLGGMVDIVEKVAPEETVKITQVNNGAKEIADIDMPTAQLKDNKRTIETSNINLTGGQEIEIEYTVKLRTDDPTFVSNRWYPANEETTLKPTPERTNDSIEFGSPSVKFQKDDFVIPVEKIWLDKHKEEADNYLAMRPDKVTAKLQKQVGSDWVDVESIDLEADHQWKGTFSPVEGGSNNKYKVIETARTNGYKKAVVNKGEFTSDSLGAEEVKITNELLRGDYSFWKFMEDGSTKFTGTDLPKFKVTRRGKLIAEDLTPNTATGKVMITGLPIGDYIVEETSVPKGFEKMPNFTIKVTENDSTNPTGLIFKVNDSTEEYRATNELKDFSVKVEKVDDKGEPLAGASFKLTGPNGYEQIATTGPVFNFTGLRPGRYTLTETDNPNLYEKLKDPITFTIAQDGNVTVDTHPNATGTGGTSGAENTIQLKVTNKKVRDGVLPRTGDYGIRKFLFIPALLAFTGIVLGALHLYHSKRKY